MRAAVCTRYGDVDVLGVGNAPQPVPGKHQVLVRVAAASLNDFDWGLVSGRPLIVRFFNGFFRPRVRIPGCDVAGRVVAAGSEVTRHAPGDRVLGDLSGCGFGAFAEYVCVPETALVPMPPGMSFEQAAALPQAGVLAMQALLDAAPVADGQRLLFNGAGGGVGTLGLQIAKQRDVEVTCVDSADKLDLLRALGADHVIDYRQVDFTRTGERYDTIVDTKTSRSPFAHARALKPGGRYVTVGGHLGKIAQMLLAAPLLKRRTGCRFIMVTLVPNRHLEDLCQRVQTGKLTPILDDSFGLEQIADALRCLVAARHQGKVVIRIESR